MSVLFAVSRPTGPSEAMDLTPSPYMATRCGSAGQDRDFPRLPPDARLGQVVKSRDVPDGAAVDRVAVDVFPLLVRAGGAARCHTLSVPVKRDKVRTGRSSSDLWPRDRGAFGTSFPQLTGAHTDSWISQSCMSLHHSASSVADRVEERAQRFVLMHDSRDAISALRNWRGSGAC